MEQAETPLLDSFENITDSPIMGSYNPAEGGSPPVAGAVEIQRLMIPERFYHAPISFTEQVLNASRSNEGAFADAYRLGVEDLQEGLRQRRNRSLWGDGRGILALVNGAMTTVNVTTDAPMGIAG